MTTTVKAAILVFLCLSVWTAVFMLSHKTKQKFRSRVLFICGIALVTISASGEFIFGNTLVELMRIAKNIGVEPGTLDGYGSIETLRWFVTTMNAVLGLMLVHNSIIQSGQLNKGETE